MIRYLLAGMLLWSTQVVADMMTKVINLDYIPAEKAIQLIQPLLPEGETLTGSGQTLIAKVRPDTMTQIRTILHKIDVPPVTFKVAIYQGDPNWLSQQNQNTTVYSTTPHSEQVRSQSVQVMSGESAFVSTDQEVPIISSVGVGFFNTGISYQQHHIENGLLIEPILQGSQVRLNVRRVREQENPAGGQQFDNQQMDTTVMLPLNQWVPLGGAEGAQDVDNSSTSYTAGRQFSQNSTLYIKVSVVSGGNQND